MKMHSKKDIYYLYKYIFLALIPLILFGIVKNAIMVHNSNASTYLIFKPAILFLINLVLGLLFDFFVLKEKKINKYLVFLTILYMITSINCPLWLFILQDIILIILLYFDKGVFNKLALTKLVDVGALYLFGRFSYTNIIESSGEYVFSFMDLIIKGQVGALGTSNLVLVGILLIVLLFNVLYKKNISLISILGFGIYFIIVSLIHDPNVYLKLLINSTALFELIILAPINNWSPRTVKGEIIYAIILGILSGVLCNHISIYIGTTIAIAILSPLHLFFDKNKHFR